MTKMLKFGKDEDCYTITKRDMKTTNVM